METLQEKIISLELTKPSDLNLELSLNGNKVDKQEDEGDETVSEPATPTTEEHGIDDNSSTSIKKKRRKRTKRGKQH